MSADKGQAKEKAEKSKKRLTTGAGFGILTERLRQGLEISVSGSGERVSVKKVLDSEGVRW